jgi:hypothetical protein
MSEKDGTSVDLEEGDHHVLLSHMIYVYVHIHTHTDANNLMGGTR